MLIDVMGDDMAIVDAARVSYGAGTTRVSEDRHLLRRLMRDVHTSPFEMCELKLRVRVPMDTWRQWIRHRTASVNEYSTRYSEAIDSMDWTEPTQWRLQATDNKQGSAGFLSEWPEKFLSRNDEGNPVEIHAPRSPLPLGTEVGFYLSQSEERLHEFAKEVYRERLELGIAKEQARKDLPLSNYTEAYWKCDLKNLLHFLRLRLNPDAQKEIRAYATAIAEIVKEWVPWTWEAFEDYVLEAETFSRMELAALADMLQRLMKIYEDDRDFLGRKPYTESVIQGSGLKGREAKEFRAKLTKLLQS